MSCLDHLNYLREKANLQKTQATSLRIVEDEEEILLDVVSMIVGLDSSCFHYVDGKYIMEDVALSKLCIGTFRSLCSGFLVAGNAFKEIETGCLSVCQTKHHPVVEACCGFCYRFIQRFGQDVVASIDNGVVTSLFSLSQQIRQDMKFIYTLNGLMSKTNNETELIQAVEALYSQNTFLDEKKRYSSLLDDCMRPYIDATNELIEKGESNAQYFLHSFINEEDGLLVLKEEGYVPVMFGKDILNKIMSLAQSVFILKRLGEDDDTESPKKNVSNMKELKDKINLMYMRKCKKLVKEVLFEKRKGIEIARRMKHEEEEEEEYVTEWPLNVLICNQKNVEDYKKIKSFLSKLKRCVSCLSRSGSNCCKDLVFFLRFKQKALYVMNCILSCISLKFEEENWSKFEDKWRESKDVIEMFQMHNDYVQRLVDISFQGKSSSPLSNCIEEMMECCHAFCVGRNREEDFDNNLLLFKTILKGILQSRKILYLQVLIERI